MFTYSGYDCILMICGVTNVDNEILASLYIHLLQIRLHFNNFCWKGDSEGRFIIILHQFSIDAFLRNNCAKPNSISIDAFLTLGSQIHPETKTYKKRTKSHKCNCFPWKTLWYFNFIRFLCVSYTSSFQGVFDLLRKPETQQFLLQQFHFSPVHKEIYLI